MTSSDLGQIWNTALAHYKEAAGLDKWFDITQLSSATSIADVTSISDDSLKRFENWRHDGGRFDQFRTFIANHLAPVESVAEYVADAASGAFPPSTAIFKAIQYFLQIATDVRADFDKVEKFFDKLGSYLKSLKILEHHVPAIPELREALMNVMSCLLVICGISTKYAKKERWSKGVKKLFHFDDDDLDKAYEDLEKKLAEENRAVQLAQLRIGQEIKDDVGEGRKEQKETHAAVERGVQLGMQNLTLLQGIEARMEEKHKQSEISDIDYIKETWKSCIFQTDTYESVKRNFLEGTGTWVFGEPAYQSWAKGEIQVLWLSGSPGSGKSYLTYSITQSLQQEQGPTSKDVAAIVYFDNRPEKARSVKVALCNLVVSLAEADALYCKRVTAQIKGTSVSIDDAGIETVWTRYVVEPLRQPCRNIIYMIMDGLEKANAEEGRSLLRLAQDIPKYQLPIRMLLSGRPELDVPVGSICDPHQAMIHVTEDKNRKDLERFVQYQYDQTIQLKQQKREVCKKVTKSLLKNAKGMFLYVDLTLKELDTMSQERAILDALHRLPRGLAELYEVSLASIAARASSPDEIYFLKKLFTLVTFAERPLSLYNYKCLMRLDNICKDYSVEDEVKGRGASLLRLTGLTAAPTKKADPEAVGPVSSRVSSIDQKTREADSDDEWADEADDDEEADEDDDSEDGQSAQSDEGEEYIRLANTFVQAVHNSLLDYLRDPSTTPTSITGSALDANAELFMLCKDVVCNEDDLESPEFSTKADLYDYAVPSLFRHLQNIDLKTIPDALLLHVLKGLKEIFTKVEVVAASLETQIDEGYFGFKLPLTPEWSGRAIVVDLLAKALSLNRTLHQQDCLDWMKTVLDKPSDLLRPLAKAHVENWLSGGTKESGTAFECALAALSTTDLTQTLSKPISDDLSRTKEEIMFVASAFPDLTQDSDAHREIALALSRSPRVAPQYAVEEINKSLATATTEWERYLALVALAEIQNNDQEYSKAVDTVHSALAILDAGNVYGNDDTRSVLEPIHKKLAYLTLAQALSGAKDVNGAVEAFHQAFELAKDDQREQFEILGDMLDVLGANKAYAGIMREIESVDSSLLSLWFAAPSHGISDGHAVVQEAAKQSQREDALIRCYNASIEFQESTPIAWVIRYHLANFYRRILGDDDKAYEELQASLEERPSDLEQEDYDEISNQGSLMLCEITFNRFRAAKDTASKKALKKELDALLHGPDDEARDVRDEVLSLLLIKPHLELNLPNKAKKILEGKLEVCRETLNNSIGDDDSAGFILLAKTLGLAGMKHEAEIALSCIFSALKPEFLRQDEEESAKDDPLQAAINFARGKSPYGDEDLADAHVTCDGCDDIWECWDKPTYLCLDCVDVMLCESCHAERMTRNSLAADGGKSGTSTGTTSGVDANSPSLGWKLFCGSNHEYIHGPVEGWTGVKDGVARIGKERIKIDEWFKKVELAFKKVKL